MKTKMILLCACIVITNNLWAETTLDIDGAVRQALENNLSLQRSRMEITTAKRKADRSWNSLIPSLSTGAVFSHPTSITGTLPNTVDVWTPLFSLSASLQFSPSIIMEIRQTKRDYEAGLLNHEAARRNLEYQVRQLYYQILLLEANTRLMKQNAESAQRRYEQIRAQQRTGQASNLDELSARLDLQTQEANVQSAVTAYNNSLDSLKYLLMIPLEEELILQDNLQTLISVEQDMETEIGGESMDAELLQKNISSLEIQRKALRTGYYAPSLNLSWNASPAYDNISDKWNDNSGQFSITLSMKLDNFLPWSPVKEQIDSLSDTIGIQQSLLRETILGHQNTVRSLQRNIAQSAEAVEILRLNVTLAEETHRMYEEVYSKGAADLQSLYSARDNLFLAQNKLLSEQYNLVSVILELEKELNLPFGCIGRSQ